MFDLDAVWKLRFSNPSIGNLLSVELMMPQKSGRKAYYSGRLLDWVAARFKFCLAVVLRPKQAKKFMLLPRRWMVELTFGRLNHSRRFSKSYERLTHTEEICIYIAMTCLMLNRLA